MVNADGSGLRRVTTSPVADFDPTWSPDGTKIAYRHQTGDDLSTDVSVIGADGSHPTNLTRSPGVADWGPSWSPDGSRIAWNSSRDHPQLPTFDGFSMRPDGAGVRLITDRIYFEYPDWSPDGKRIAFMSQVPEGTDNYEVFVINADGSGLRRLTTSPGSDGWPAWSPDGTKIAFSSQRDDCGYAASMTCLSTGDIGPYQTLYVMNADGSGQTRLTDTFGQFATWSPDGRYILFSPGLHLIRPDGTGLAALPVHGLPGDAEMPDWLG